MEIAILIGMLAAFFAGAYVRSPSRARLPGIGEREAGAGGSVAGPHASAEAEEESRKREEDRIAQLENMLNYIGKGRGRED